MFAVLPTHQLQAWFGRPAWMGCAVVWLALVTTSVGSEPTGAERTGPFKIVAYVPNWIDLASFSKSIDYENVTHINIAFENPTNDQGELSFHVQNALLIQQAHARNVKVLVSIGGGSAANNTTLKARYAHLLRQPQRTEFANGLVKYVQAHEFDGLDVDIEGPSITDDYGPFIDELTRAFKPSGKLLTAALSKGYGGAKVPESVFAQFDFINIMAYDAAGSWNPNAPGQHSSLDFTKSNVQYWLDRGLPKSKAVLGVPFYGYGFGADFKKGAQAYSDILAKYPGAEFGDQIGNTYWYNGLPTMRAKTKYAIDQELGGIMIWSLDNDVAGDKSLFKAIVETYHSAMITVR